VILIDGLVRADGALDELTRSSAQVLTVKAPDPARARETLERMPRVVRVEPRAADSGFTTFRLELDGDHDLGESLGDLVRREGWGIRELRRDDRSLEQVFRELSETAVEVQA
jgi:hypothetical protein